MEISSQKLSDSLQLIVIPAESSSTLKPYERFSCREKRAVEQEVGIASGNNFLYLHAIFVYQPACCFWLESDPLTAFNRYLICVKPICHEVHLLHHSPEMLSKFRPESYLYKYRNADASTKLYFTVCHYECTIHKFSKGFL